jgi:hypothetical protein
MAFQCLDCNQLIEGDPWWYDQTMRSLSTVRRMESMRSLAEATKVPIHLDRWCFHYTVRRHSVCSTHESACSCGNRERTGTYVILGSSVAHYS